ncbi:DUF732 domain-containing protein [Mycobacterium decipiens]|uniref:DUF732 domain-containing protein n=1 Tax=Mycobacterium decipiens TaxID=1430326 RepID=A0A1X2M082_9MYCO|nr:DUF732 domain-containing protein [Mycobacterium decipiens]OSC43028.1 hypothetical protein B8W66_01040 [Mycobacterium decipiens]
MRAWRRRRLTIRLLAGAAGLLAVAAAFAAPADADSIDNAFISALNSAGVNYGDAGNAIALGHSVCPMLSKQGGTFASAASSVTGTNNMSPEMAAAFTSIAISMYCPTVLAGAATGIPAF